MILYHSTGYNANGCSLCNRNTFTANLITKIDTKQLMLRGVYRADTVNKIKIHMFIRTEQHR